MREFNYTKLRESSWDAEVLSFVAQIREHKGRQDLYLRLAFDSWAYKNRFRKVVTCIVGT